MFKVNVDKKEGTILIEATLPPVSQAGKRKVTVNEAKSHLLSKGLRVGKLISGRNVSNMDKVGEVKALFLFSLLDFKPAPVVKSNSDELPTEEARRPRRRQTQKKET